MTEAAHDQPLDSAAPAAKRTQASTRGSRALRRGAVGTVVDGNSVDARYLREYEKSLLQHVGRNPSAVERALVTRACRLALFVEKMDQRALAAGMMSEHDSNQYLAWSNALRRTLIALGLKGAPAPRRSLSEILA